MIYIYMESISNGVEDYLIEGLSFKLSPGSSYVTDRRKSTFWASGSNIYIQQAEHVLFALCLMEKMGHG